MTSGRRPKAVFVVTRYGAEVCGGAETHCRLIAEHMREEWEVTVATTCALDYLSWRNHFEPGESSLSGVRVKRFPTARERNMDSFSRVHEALVRTYDPALADEWMRLQGPDCPELLDSLADLYTETDLFLFFGYLYATTYFGLPTVAQKAALIPMAHVEPMLEFPLYDPIFEHASFLLFNSIEESRLLRRRFSLAPDSGAVVGVYPRSSSPLPEVNRTRHPRPYLLFLGRIDYPKGVGDLLHWYVQFGIVEYADLLLAGEVLMEIPNVPGVHACGYVDQATKRDLIRGSQFLVQPSPHESLSLTLLEAWDQSRAVLANGCCDVLQGQIARSGGGLTYSGGREFRDTVLYLLNRPARRALMGVKGNRYLNSVYQWSAIEAKLEYALERVQGKTAVPKSSPQ